MSRFVLNNEVLFKWSVVKVLIFFFSLVEFSFSTKTTRILIQKNQSQKIFFYQLRWTKIAEIQVQFIFLNNSTAKTNF